MDRILEDYLTHLLSKGQYKHTPFYACRLKPEARRRLCCALLLHLTKEGSLEVRQTAVEDLDHWFSFWRDEQLGDVQPDELHAVLDLVRSTHLQIHTQLPFPQSLPGCYQELCTRESAHLQGKVLAVGCTECGG